MSYILIFNSLTFLIEYYPFGCFIYIAFVISFIETILFCGRAISIANGPLSHRATGLVTSFTALIYTLLMSLAWSILWMEGEIRLSIEDWFGIILSIAGLVMVACDLFPRFVIRIIRRHQPTPDVFPPAILSSDAVFRAKPGLDKALLTQIVQRRPHASQAVQWVLQNCAQHWAIGEMLRQLDDRSFLWLIETMLANPSWNRPARQEESAPTWMEHFLRTFLDSPRIPAFAQIFQPFMRRDVAELTASQREWFLAIHNVLIKPEPSVLVASSHRLKATPLADGFKQSWCRLAALAEVTDSNALQRFALPDNSHTCLHVPLPESRTALLTYLERVEEAAIQARDALAMSSPAARQRELSLATEKIRNLHDQAPLTIPIREFEMLQQVMRQWLDLLIHVGAEQAHEAPELTNPYIAGDPVTGASFFDRERMLQLITGRIHSGQSIALVGHRRSGKTSILMQIAAKPTPDYLPVYMTMERLQVAEDSGQLLYRIIRGIDASLRSHDVRLSPLLPAKQFLDNIADGLDAFFMSVATAVKPRRVILCLDEYELLEELIEEGDYESRLVQPFINRIKTEPQFGLIAAGRAGPIRLQQRFTRPLFASLSAEWVDLLDESDASQLITNPVPDFLVNYETQVIDEVFRLTSGQPYLFQLICRTLIDQLQEQLRLDKNRKLLITTTDLQNVLTEEHFEKGSYYYRQLWSEVGPIEREVLHTVAIMNSEGCTIDNLLAQIKREAKDIRSTLKELINQHILVFDSKHYRFTIPLLCQWIQQQAHIADSSPDTLIKSFDHCTGQKINLLKKMA